MTIPKIASYDIATAATEYHNKVNWRPEAGRAVLLIHDMQNYFINFYGEEAEITRRLTDNIKQLKAICKAAGIPVVYTAQPAHQNPRDRALLTDFWGPGLKDSDNEQQIVSALAPDDDDTQLVKWRYSAFQRNALHQLMHEQRRDQLIICGVYAHIGILATSLEAFMTDIQAFVVSDVVADFSAEDHRMAIDYISRRCGVVTELAQLERDLALPGETGISAATMRADIAAIMYLDESELTDNASPEELGIDSIRLMELVERWRRQGAAIEFADLAERPALGLWWELVAGSAEEEQAREERALEEKVAANA